MKVSIITVNFNQPAVTDEFLTSVIKFGSGLEIEIIVVDNGSKIDSTKVLRGKYPGVNFIRSAENIGFAGGNNLGIEVATGDYLFLVNNDTEFTERLIGTLIKVLENHPDTAIVSPKIRYFDKKEIIQYAGFTSMNFATGRNKCIGQFEKDDGQYDRPASLTSYAHGAAMMIRKTAIDKVGLMPENFFLYYEEMDWCEQFKRNGYEIQIEPNALIYHKESISVGKKSGLKEYFMTRNRILFIRRNAPFLSRMVFYLHYTFLVTPRNLLGYMFNGSKELSVQFLKAIWWNISHSKHSRNLGYPIKSIAQSPKPKAQSPL